MHQGKPLIKSSVAEIPELVGHLIGGYISLLLSLAINGGQD